MRYLPNFLPTSFAQGNYRNSRDPSTGAKYKPHVVLRQAQDIQSFCELRTMRGKPKRTAGQPRADLFPISSESKQQCVLRVQKIIPCYISLNMGIEESRNPDVDVFQNFIEGLDFSGFPDIELQLGGLEIGETSTDDSRLAQFDEMLRLSNFFNLKSVLDHEHLEPELSGLVQKDFVERGFTVYEWEMKETGIYTGLISDNDFLLGVIVVRRFALNEDELDVLRPPRHGDVLRTLYNIPTNFNTHIVRHILIGVIQNQEEGSDEMAYYFKRTEEIYERFRSGE